MSVRRRSRVDTLLPRDAKSWLVIRNQLSQVVSFVELAERADLRTVLLSAAADVRAIGTIEDFDPRQSTFFFRVPSGRLCLELQFAPPANPLSEWPLPRPSASITECIKIIEAVAASDIRS